MARATKLTLSVHRTRLVFTFRRFKTQKAKRSKKISQVVLPLYGLPFKELAIAKSHLGRRRKSQVQVSLWAHPHILLILAGLIGISYFALHLKQAPDIKLVAATKSIQRPKKTEQVKYLPKSIPVHITIPAINLDAQLAQVGLKADGALQVPSDPYMAGWYTGSPSPGEVGPAIIDGHVDQVGGIAIFWHLRELKPGDLIEISRQDGTVARFKVDSLQQFAQDNFPTQKVYGNISYPGLRLVTCGGIFNPDTGHYSDNIVVFASLKN